MPRRLSQSKDVLDFIDSVENTTRQDDAKTLLKLFKKITRERPKLWHSSIIGFGQFHYKYETGREGDSPNVAFSPRKANLVMYILGSIEYDHPLLARLGKYKTGKVCLYVNKLADIDMSVLEDIIRLSYTSTNEKYAD